MKDATQNFIKRNTQARITTSVHSTVPFFQKYYSNIDLRSGHSDDGKLLSSVGTSRKAFYTFDCVCISITTEILGSLQVLNFYIIQKC